MDTSKLHVPPFPEKAQTTALLSAVVLLQAAWKQLDPEHPRFIDHLITLHALFLNIEAHASLLVATEYRGQTWDGWLEECAPLAAAALAVDEDGPEALDRLKAVHVALVATQEGTR